MSESVAAALVTAAGAVIVTMLTIVLPALLSTRRYAMSAAHSAHKANEQVSNDHDTNLRVEADSRHWEIMTALGTQSVQIAGLERRLTLVEEDTQPRLPNRKKAL